jgi:hypothetical protein
MAKTIADMIGETIFRRTLDTLLKPGVPVDNSNANAVAYEVEKAIKPVVVNAMNSEPWYRSRIYLGLIAAGLGAIAQHFGIQVSGQDIQLVTNSIPELLQAGGTIAEIAGLLYAAYGRWVGSRKKPLGK